jgi:tetratricopeptide (TPR) repeat protein
MSVKTMMKCFCLALLVCLSLQFAIFCNTCLGYIISPLGPPQPPGNAKFRQLLQDGRFQEARDMARERLTKTPNDAVMLAILGYAEAGLKNWEVARRTVKRAIQTAPKELRDDLRLLLANIYLAEGNSSAAQDVLQDMLSRNPGNTKALLGLGFFFRQTGDIPRAADYFERVLRVEDDQETALRALLQIHMERGDYAAVARVARRIPAGSKSKGLGYYFEALALARQEGPDYPAVIALLEKALDASGPRPQVLYTLGYVLLKDQREEEALGVLKEAVALAPDFFEAHKLLGVVSLQQNQPKAASKYLEKALSIEDSPDLRHLLGKAYLLQGRSEDGVAQLMKSLESADLDPDKQSAVEGLYRYVGGDLEQSEAALRRALETKPGALDARILLIANLLKQGRFEGAAREARQGISLHPDQRVLLLNLVAQAKLAAGDLDQAEQALKDALEGDPGSALTRFNLSAVYLRRGQYGRARAELKAILVDDPKHAHARLRLAKVHQATANYDEAERILLGPKGEAPSAPLLLKEMVLLKIRQRKYGAALEYAQAMIAENRTLFEGYLLESQAYASLGKAADAIRSLDAGLEKAGESRESLAKAARLAAVNGWHDNTVLYLQRHGSQFGLGDPQLVKLYARELIEVGNASKAREIVRESLSPTDPDAVFLLARSYIADGDQVKAEAYLDAALEAGISEDVVEKQRAELRMALRTDELEEALRSKPDDPMRYQALAEAHEFLGDLDAAIEVYKHGMGKGGSDLEFRTQIARLFLKKGDTQRAIEVASDVLDQLGERPGDGGETAFRANAVLGMSWRQQGDLKKAEKALERATAEGSHLARAFYELAKIKLAKGETDAAIQLLESAIGVEPRSVRYYLALAEVYQRSGRIHESIAVYEEGLERNPDSVPLLNNVALLYLSQGANEEAISRSKQALQLAPEDANVLDTVGWVHLQSKQLEKAIRYLEKAVDRKPGSSLYRYHLGLGYLAKGVIELAKGELEEALTSQTNAPWAPEIRKALATIASRN